MPLVKTEMHCRTGSGQANWSVPWERTRAASLHAPLGSCSLPEHPRTATVRARAPPRSRAVPALFKYWPETSSSRTLSDQSLKLTSEMGSVCFFSAFIPQGWKPFGPGIHLPIFVQHLGQITFTTKEYKKGLCSSAPRLCCWPKQLSWKKDKTRRTTEGSAQSTVLVCTLLGQGVLQMHKFWYICYFWGDFFSVNGTILQHK